MSIIRVYDTLYPFPDEVPVLDPINLCGIGTCFTNTIIFIVFTPCRNLGIPEFLNP